MQKRDVAVLILRRGDKILLEKRSSACSRFPNTWGLFGGGIKDGESPEEALRREVMEEVSLTLGKVRLTGTYPYRLPVNGEAGHVFVFESVYDGSKRLSGSGGRMHWLTIDQALEKEMDEIYRGIVSRITLHQMPLDK
ncbi:MAG: NUDIX hydrolase [Candidatus Paceibacterota bacterium]